MKKAPALQVEEVSGNKYPDSDAAWRAALPSLSADLQAVIRDLLERGELVIIEGKIDIPCKHKQTVSAETDDPSTR